MEKSLWMLGLAGVFAALVAAPAQSQFAHCNNNGKSCSEAVKISRAGCVKRYGGDRQASSCYKDGDQAFANCMATGEWKTQFCNRSGLARN